MIVLTMAPTSLWARRPVMERMTAIQVDMAHLRPGLHDDHNLVWALIDEKWRARAAASMPVLRRPHDHHRDLRARL
jgi:hypothetical protein